MYLLDASPRKVEKKYYKEQRITTNYIQLVIFYNTISKIISKFFLKYFSTISTDFLPVWVWVKWPSLKFSSPPSLVHLITGWGLPSQGIEMVWRSPSKASISSKSSQEGLALKKREKNVTNFILKIIMKKVAKLMKYDLKKVQCTKGQEISEENYLDKKTRIFFH